MKPSIQARMAQNVEELSQEFKFVQLMMQQMLDKMNGLEAWRTIVIASLGSLLTKTTEALESLRQTGSIAEYQTKFDQLAHSILLYNQSYDDVFFVTRFLGGLKEEIRAPLILYRPPNLEVAGTLAHLQEAELEASKSKAQPRSEFRDSYKGPVRGNARMDKSKFRKEEPKHVDTPNSASSDKLSALKAYRRANNLCFTCGEKWTSRKHKCPTQIPLHVIQELLEAVQVDPEPVYDSSEEDTEPNPGQVVMAVKQSVSSGIPKKNRTLRLRGFIGNKEVLILLDSGSAGTFVSQELAAQIQQEQKPFLTITFHIC
ncbi:unnamed protein product [Miscanthus lutarioriparius]|uniref:Retrotransposon gag domain-containing protein n=1 Tax=Miscanthus lutarioriparius TaxID=422564 RepID=A0A811P4D6_9POAL|nr:unnamed protein product [Miscanthus lutarioriparius]